MLSTPRSVRHRLLLSAAAAGLIAVACAAEAAPAVAPLQIPPRGAVPDAGVPDTVLKRLPAGAAELTFRGESTTRSFVVQLSRAEAARTGVFQLALLNAVSLLPDRSIVKVIVNGTVLAAVQATSPEKPTTIPVRIPPGLLVPGTNTVQITSALTHRVDCSVQATYELWATLDPVQTGFVVPRDAAYQVRSLDDLALEPLADDGTTRIHLRVADDADPAALAQAAGLIDAVVRRAGLVRPVVDVGPDRGTGPGLDVVLSGNAPDTSDLVVFGRGNGATIARDKATGRLIVMLDSTDAAALGAGGPARGRRFVVQQGFRKSLAELGVPTEIFAGRHYTSSIDVTLPPDFLASNDRARLLLDGSHSGTLVEGDGLVFRVNGTLVSSLPLAAGKPERFQHSMVELPLRFFHPGHNEVSIEGTTLAVADGQCDTASMPRDPRLTIAGTSELDFPTFAHLGTLPQIPAALASDALGPEGAVHLYLAQSGRAAVGAGLTMLANMAATQSGIGAPQLHFGAPSDLDPPGLVIGAGSDLPESLSSVLGKLAVPAAAAAEQAPAPQTGTATARADDGAPATDATAAVDTPAAPAGDAPTTSASLTDTAGKLQDSILARAQALLRDRGFFFGGDEKAALALAPGSLLIAAVSPQAESRNVAGVALPQLAHDPAHWLVVTTDDAATIGSALTGLVASGSWTDLAGQAVSYDPKTNVVQVLQPRTVSYVLPDKLVLSDVRPILGGIMSDNVTLSIILMFVLMLVLGVSTHLVVRRIGVR